MSVYVVWSADFQDPQRSQEELIDAVKWAEAHGDPSWWRITWAAKEGREWKKLGPDMTVREARQKWAESSALVWEPYPSVKPPQFKAGPTVERARVPGGWLVNVVGSGVTFVPDSGWPSTED